MSISVCVCECFVLCSLSMSYQRYFLASPCTHTPSLLCAMRSLWAIQYHLTIHHCSLKHIWTIVWGFNVSDSEYLDIRTHTHIKSIIYGRIHIDSLHVYSTYRDVFGGKREREQTRDFSWVQLSTVRKDTTHSARLLKFVEKYKRIVACVCVCVCGVRVEDDVIMR